MAPRTDFHRFWIDFSMILEWISQVYFDRYCDEVEIEFGFVLPRGRKDAKLRSSEGMKARSRAQNGIRSHVQRSCSKSVCSLTLHSVAHRSALPCSTERASNNFKQLIMSGPNLIKHEHMQTWKKNNTASVSYTHLRAHETGRNLVCRLLLEKKK